MTHRSRTCLAAVLCVLAGALPAGAVDYTWGVAAGNWSNSANWIPNGVPSTDVDTVTVSSGTVTLDVSPQLQSLTLSGSGSLQSSDFQSLFVTGDVSLTGSGSFLSNPSAVLVLKAPAAASTLEATMPIAGDLRIEATNPVVLASSVTVTGKVELASGILDASPSSYTLSVGGDFVVNPGANFSANQGKVVFTGPTSTVTFNSPPPHFWDVTVLAGAALTTQNSLAVDNNCSPEGLLETNGFNLFVGGHLTGSGSLIAAGPETITVNGDFMVSGFTEASSTVFLGGSISSTLQGLPFWQLVIDKDASGVTVVSNGPLTIKDTLTMTRGTWNVGSYTHLVAGDWDSASANFGFAAGTSTISLTGAGPLIATKGTPEPFYNLVLEAGGTLTTPLQVDHDLTVAAGAAGTLDLGTNALTVGRHLTQVLAAVLTAAGSQDITVGGNWNITSFWAGTSRVVFNNAGQDSNISGNSTFYDFSCTTPGKKLRFQAGATQTVTGSFVITGASASHVELLSQTPGTQWTIDNAGDSESVSFVSVQDSAVLGNDITVSDGTDLGNNDIAVSPRWIFGSDVSPPVVSSTQPADGATGASVTGTIRAVFSEAMDPLTIDAGTFLLDASGVPVTGTVTYDAPTLTAIFTPDAPLAFVAGYTATLTTGVKDLAGNPLAADFAWSFTTQEQHPLLTVSAGSGNPAEFSASADAAGVAVLQLRLAASVEDTVLDSLTVAGSGTGNEAVDIKTVRLYLDSDADGQVDVGERELGSASFTENDGTVTFSGLGITIPVGTSIHLLVAYDLSVFTLAGASTVPASSPGVPPLWALLPAAVTLLGLLLLRLRGRRTGTGTLVSAGALAVALLAASCVLQPVVDCTYTAVASRQEDIQARGSITGRAATVSGTFPISGPVVTVERLTGGL